METKSTHDEIPMALSELKSIIKHSKMLMVKMENFKNEEGDIPAWIQAKITKAEDYLSAACKFFDGEIEETEEEHAYIDQPEVQYIEVHSALSDQDRLEIIEKLAEIEHEAWMSWAKSVESEISEERKNKFSEKMVPFDQLDESSKEVSRSWAEEMVDAIEPLLDKSGGKVKQMVTKVDIDENQYPALSGIFTKKLDKDFLLEEAEYELRTPKEELKEMWDADKPHFRGQYKHVYKEGEDECAYCMRPKDWKN